MQQFDMLGVMVDCSRNAVMNLPSLKKFADALAKMGYNTLMLYTEDTFEVNGQPYFGYMRGRYSKEEIKELDDHCAGLGIELVPCIQTLAHLNAIFRWRTFWDVRDCDDILLIGEEKTYALIEDMLSTISECFRSKRIHIGMDEAYRVGLGKYLDRNGYRDRFEVLKEHLGRVVAICEKYGKKPMLWSDMFVKHGLGVQYYQGSEGVQKPKDLTLPDASLVYWDYYHTNYSDYTSCIDIHKLFDREIVFAGGVWTWKGFAPDNGFSLDSMVPAVKACADKGIRNVFFTMWGDDGAECASFSVLPSLFHLAEVAKGNSDAEDIKRRFQEMFGADYDSFFLLDKLNYPNGAHTDAFGSPNKYLLYNDPFTGVNDYRCTAEDNAHYAALCEALLPYAESGEYAYIFRSAAAHARALSLKSDLGVRTRKAYQAGDREELYRLATEDYTAVTEALGAFYREFRALWFTENKPHGFDIQDIRFGGLRQRLLSCKERLLDYCNGAISEIPELAEAILPTNGVGVSWARTATVNVISHTI